MNSNIFVNQLIVVLISSHTKGGNKDESCILFTSLDCKPLNQQQSF